MGASLHITETPEGAIVDVRVIPRAGRSIIAGIRDSALLVRLASAPVDGAANDDLVATIARALDRPRRDVRIMWGERSRTKRVLVTGAGAAAALAALIADGACPLSAYGVRLTARPASLAAKSRRRRRREPKSRMPTADTRASEPTYQTHLTHQPHPPPVPHSVAVTADLLLENVDVVYTCGGKAPKRGTDQGDARPIRHASVAAAGGTIVFVGRAEESQTQIALTADATRIDGRGRILVPGFVDPHTHLVFAGDRRHELEQRLQGATYAEIAAGGGGIVRTVAATRAASQQDLVDGALPRLASMLACGTTTAEVKSGYGLDLASEMTILRAIRALETSQPIEIAATFLGAHEIPVEFRHRQADYVRLVIDEMLPAVALEHLAEWCDVFCEEGVFTPDESRAILEAGLRHGLKARIHADELALSGGAAVAATIGARSADHLIFIDEAHASALARAGVIATLLPAAAFFLKLGRFAPARLLIDCGVPVALATDLNPGGGFSPSMPFVMTLACFGMHLTLEEALVASTVNAAAALDRHDRVGSLSPGKQMDGVLIDGTLSDLVRVGAPVIHRLIKRGRIVWPESAR